MVLPRFSVLPIERRKSTREPQNFIVRLKFDDGAPWSRAMLNNLSDGGACLSISAAKTIPAEFTLILPPNLPRRCRPVWRSGDRIGVEFLDSEIFED